MDAIVNSLMYLRRDVPVKTLNYRKGWARRKHSNDLVFLSNIMIIWAKEFRFYRNYNRSLTYQNFFRNTYLSFNLNISTILPARHTRAGVAAVGAGWTYTLLRYFEKKGHFYRSPVFNAHSGVSWAYTSYNMAFTKKNSEKFRSGVYVPLLATNYSSSTAVDSTSTLSYSPLTILAPIVQYHTAWLTALYATLVKLFLFRCII